MSTTLPLAQRITQGPAEVRPNSATVTNQFNGYDIVSFGLGTKDQCRANATLTAEAFTVCHETGLSPLQLAELCRGLIEHLQYLGSGWIREAGEELRDQVKAFTP